MLKEFDIQVDKQHYNFSKYCDLKRWSSYWYQLKMVLDLCPNTICEIGPGDYVFANYIKHNTDIKYISVDFASDLKPDVVADVRSLPFEDDKFDVVCAFEVLEHLPFNDFEKNIKELLRVTNKNLLISVPHWGRSFAFSFQVPFFRSFKFSFKLPYKYFNIPHIWDGQHYWEIGKENYPQELVRKKIWDSGGKIVLDFVPPENTYHHFFLIEK